MNIGDTLQVPVILTPEIKQWLDTVILPKLLEQYLQESSEAMLAELVIHRRKEVASTGQGVDGRTIRDGQEKLLYTKREAAAMLSIGRRVLIPARALRSFARVKTNKTAARGSFEKAPEEGD